MYINNLKDFFYKTETDIFTTKPLQNSTESSIVKEYRPVSSGTDEIIEFFVPGCVDYVDSNLMKLYIKVQILDDKGKPVLNEIDPADDSRKGVHVAPCNNFMDSLFRNVSVELNGKSITSPGSGNNHFYRSYIEKLCNYGSEAKRSHLASSMYYDDDAAAMDDFESSGFQARMSRMNKSGSIEMIGFVHTELSNTNRLLLSNVDMRLKFYRNRPEFSLMSNVKPEAASPSFKIVITEAVLLVRKVQVNPGIAESHRLALLKKDACYPIQRVEIKTFTLAKDTLSRNLENIFMSQIPKRLMMVMVAENSINNYKKNPYNFQNFNIGSILLSGDSFTNIRRIRTDFEREEFMEAYSSFNDAIGVYFHDRGVAISPAAYKASNCIFSWDLTPDYAANQPHASMPSSGTLRIELSYLKPLPENIVVILYAEFVNFININKNRDIFTDYSS